MQAMQGSASEHSYAQYSDSQNHNFHVLAKPRLSDAIKHLLNHSDVQASAGTVLPRSHFAVADLGCAHGRNTLDCAEFVVRSLLENHVSDPKVMDIQYFFSDLASNDFNALFQSLKPYLHQSADSRMANSLPKFFAAGVPGSFYGQLFPKASLDLVICSYGLHWLSQVPPSLVDRNSPAWNGGHTWISRTKPSKAVADAYARQSEMDVRRFLRSRAEELASGGILFLLWVAWSSCTPEGKSVYFSSIDDFLPIEYTFEFFDRAWKEMIDEGLVASEHMDMFNMVLYFFNQQELENAVKDVPELRVLHIESINNRAIFVEHGNRMQTVEQWIGLVASTIKPAVEAHLGKSKADELFKKVKAICLLQDCFHARLSYTLVVASLQRV